MAGMNSPGAGPNTPVPSKDTGFTPGDDTWTQMKNMFSILTGNMTEEGKEQFLLARDIRNEESDCKRCEDQRDYLIKYSTFVLSNAEILVDMFGGFPLRFLLTLITLLDQVP